MTTLIEQLPTSRQSMRVADERSREHADAMAASPMNAFLAERSIGPATEQPKEPTPPGSKGTGSATADRVEELGRIILAYSDVTEKLQESHDQLHERVTRLQEELGQKNIQLQRTNRLAALGEMAAGLAHEIRNPLGGIQLYAAMLGQDVEDRPESAATVVKIIEGVKRVELLVSQVLQFTREINAHPQPCDLTTVAVETVELARMQIASKCDNRHSCGGSIRVDLVTPSSLQHSADGRLVSQLILNLILNGSEALTDVGGGRVLVELCRVDNEVKIVVEDNGPGIAPELLDRVFNPFFTTKDEGTGLGLSIVHRIVEAHNGTIIASNNPDGGARFEVLI